MPDDAVVTRITDRVKKQLENLRVKQAAAAQRSQAIATGAEPGWRALRERVKELCRDANANLGDEVFSVRVSPDSVLLVDARVGTGRLIEASYQSGTNLIRYDRSRQTFIPDVDADGRFTLRDASTPSPYRPVTVEDMAARLMDVLTQE